jgi:N-formylglutamate amidohydrolase
MWTISYSRAKFVSSHPGTLPVILTCPHDGNENPGVPERTGSASGCPPFTKRRDLHTRQITEGVAQLVLDLFGEAPYVVIAEFHRRYIDANRSPDCAYEDPKAKQYYDEYHATIRNFVSEIRAENGGLGLFFDIHGTDNEPDTIFLGTGDGSTIARLLQVDPQAMWRRRSLRGFLEAASYKVSPQKPGIPETLPGGFTVRTYGSSNSDGLDAIQIEIGSRLRKDGLEREVLTEVLAYATNSLVARYADTHTLAALGKSVELFGVVSLDSPRRSTKRPRK